MKQSNILGGRITKSAQGAPVFTGWNYSRRKRLIDLIGASLLLLLLFPVLLFVAFLVAITSHGPVLFRQSRVGQGGSLFQLLKFRSMSHNPQDRGSGLTAEHDPRVTRVGHFLRKWKLDELPQLVNVIFGDMSLVGPRPDLWEFLSALGDKEKDILRLRPGITSLASVCFRNEEMILGRVPQPELTFFYVDKILPEKIRIDMNYAERASFISDLHILAATALKVCGTAYDATCPERQISDAKP